MPLSQADKTRLKEWFSERCTQYACRACGKMAWSIEDSLAGMIGMPSPGNVNLAGHNPLCPFVVIVCNNCGLTDFFSASVIGIDRQQET